MINKIGINLYKRHSSENLSQHIDYYNTKPQEFKSSAGMLNLNYFVPFTGKKDYKGTSKLDTLMFYTDTSAKKLISQLKIDAAETGYDTITALHVIKRALIESKEYINDLDKGKKDYNTDLYPFSVQIFMEDVTEDIFKTPSSRKKILPIIDKNIDELDKILAEHKPSEKSSNKNIVFSDDLTDSIWAVRDEKDTVSAYSIIDGALSSQDEITFNFARDLNLAMKETVMLNNSKHTKSFSVYEPKAKNVLKNLSLGTNVFVTYDSAKESPRGFLDTLLAVNAKNSKDKRFDFTELNLKADSGYFISVVNKLAKDKSKTHIVIANPSVMTINESLDDEDIFDPNLMDSDLTKLITSAPANVKYVLYDTQDNYYSTLSLKPGLYNNFEESAIPVLNTANMIKFFKENPSLTKDIPIPFSKNAVEKVVEVSAQLDGVFPEKTQNLMKKITSYYAGKKEINDNDITNYVKEATNLFKKEADDSSIDVIFDTGKKIKDMVGKPATQKEASLLVKQIKSNKIGTKGIILYSQDGSPGSGRRYTAKAIAGEARVPYIEMNAVDFGTKDVDLFGGGALTPEKAVKKLFSIVKTQAEANAHKSAVLFIENFEYFTLGEMISMYHEKAMAQLLREMDKANSEGLNILVAGSVSNPEWIGEATMKSFKFVDAVEVSSPAFNKVERLKVIEHALKDNKFKLAGSSEEQKQTLAYAADITQYFPFIQLKNLVKKARSVADERGHKMLTKADFTEAYLQLTTGRPALNKIEKHEKEIVTSHECGHAVNLEVMNNVAKTLGKPWHIPNKVNFITLDPRGFYGGAVYGGKDNNSQMSFENVFGDIVWSFGGNSAENYFYGMDGSYGISCDMESVRDCAELMVKTMGLGAKTGKMAIAANENLSDNMKKLIEDDERVIINNAKITSDMITEVFADFNKWFTREYSPLVGTGDCMVDGDKFRKVLNKWKSEQSPEKKKELELCDQTIINIMEATKKGIAVRKE